MSKYTLTILVAAASFLCSTLLSAAAVTFSNTTLTGVADVDTSGALVGAFNTGASGPTQNYLVGGNIYVPAGNPLGNGFGGANPANAIGNPSFDAALNTSSYGTTSLTLSGLNVGDSYRIQMFMTDNRGCCSGRTVTVGDGGANSQLTPAIGTPQSVIGNFTADAATQSITFNGNAGIGYLNGYQLRNLSDPSGGISFTMGAISGVGDISQNGTLVDAQNTGGGPATTVAGITFNPGGNPLGSGFTGANPGNVIGDVDFDALLNTASYSFNGLTLTGLTPGDDYEFQGFITDNRSCCSGRTVDIADGIGDAITTGGIGTPQFVLGTFTAEDDNQTIFFGGADVGYLNAFQLRNVTAATVPEPSAVAVWLIAGAIAFGFGLVRMRSVRILR